MCSIGGVDESEDLHEFTIAQNGVIAPAHPLADDIQVLPSSFDLLVHCRWSPEGSQPSRPVDHQTLAQKLRAGMRIGSG